jgi:hypothetical protein
MFGSVFGPIGELVDNMAKIVTAPVQIAANLANTAIEPVAEVVGEVVDSTKTSKSSK